MKLLAALAFLGINFYVYEFLATNEVIPPRATFEGFPLEFGPWRCPGSGEMDAHSRKFLGATDYFMCNYFHEETGEVVDLYVGYHASQVRREGGGGGENSIHPPEHCLPGAGWDIIDSGNEPIDFVGLPSGHGLREDRTRAKRFVIAKSEDRQLVYFWYQGQGRVITANEDVILHRFWDRATKGRTDGSLVRFTTPIRRGDLEAAEARFHELASLVIPALPPYVPE